MANELQVEVDHSGDFKLKRRERERQRESWQKYMCILNCLHLKAFMLFSASTFQGGLGYN